MTSLRISVAGREYEVACDDGQEPHLKSIARTLDTRVRALSEALGRPGDSAQLLMLASLMLTDELQDTTKSLESLRGEVHSSSHSFETNKQIELENAVAATIHDIAERVESIAQELERV